MLAVMTLSELTTYRASLVTALQSAADSGGITEMDIDGVSRKVDPRFLRSELDRVEGQIARIQSGGRMAYGVAVFGGRR